MDEALRAFLDESYENLEQLDQDLIELEQDPKNQDILSSIFRTIHTIKGTGGFFGYSKLESISHIGETLLSKLREGQLELSKDMITALLSTMDSVREILSSIEATEVEGDKDYSDLVNTLTLLTNGETPGGGEKAKTTKRSSTKSAATKKTAAAKDSGDDDTGKAEPDSAEATSDAEPKKESKQPAAKPAAAKAESAAAVETQSVAQSNIRVNVKLLDDLMNLVGELVLTRNQIMQSSAAQTDSALSHSFQRLNLITTELQEGVMKTRLQPINRVWSNFPRVVRDLSLACKKSIQLVMEGKDTELDKTIIESIKDPLTHLVRNSVDHGIESPSERKKAGKSEEGTLTLRAFHEGGQVNIEISDDGKGLDAERIKEKALKMGLVTPENVSRIQDSDIGNLIFLPGFSTAKKVTNVSGRGVGMDVVRTNIEKIGGTVDVKSSAGKGTTFRLKIPLTLAIIPALTITSAGERYAIPQLSLLETVRLDGEQLKSGIERMHGTLVYRLRGNLLPLIDLNKELQVNKKLEDQQSASIVVLQAEGRQFGLIVDEINDSEEIVVKPLGKELKNIPIYAGATIMGDGTVALILDIVGLGKRAGAISELSDQAMVDKGTVQHLEENDLRTLLVLGIGENTRVAIPLSEVARLEQLPRKTIEYMGTKEVVQYRGEIMPLIKVSRALGVSEVMQDTDVLHVVVYSANSQSVGLVVDNILDVAEGAVEIKREDKRAGVLGTMVFQKHVTDLIDVEEIIRQIDPCLIN